MEIVDIHSISPANKCLFADGTSVACFALVSLSDRSTGGKHVEKRIIPIREEDIGSNLLGRDVRDFEIAIAFIDTFTQQGNFHTH